MVERHPSKVEVAGSSPVICSNVSSIIIMLGFEREHKPITGKFARRIREQLYRVRTGQLNRTDCLSLKFQLTRDDKYTFTWEGPEAAYMNPKFRDNLISDFARTLSQYIVIVDRWVQFDFSTISKQMKFLKGYGLASVKFREDKDCQTKEIKIDSVDKEEGKKEDTIVRALTSFFETEFENDIKKKQYVYVKVGDFVTPDEDEDSITISLKIFRPYADENTADNTAPTRG